MLLGDSNSSVRPVAVVTSNRLFTRRLSSILEDWNFDVVDAPGDAKVTFVERGVTPPEGGEVVWLSPMPLSEENFLVVPLSLTELYGVLEKIFFPIPRRHIRVATDASAVLEYGGKWRKAQLISLSDRGGRFLCDDELHRQSSLTVEIKLPGRLLRTAAEVLYCVSAGDHPGRQQPQVGVLFKPVDSQLVIALRRFIEKGNIESACAREGIAGNDPCLSWIDYAADPWVDLP